MKINLIYSSLQVTASLLLVFLLIPAGCGLNTAGHMRHSPVLMEQYREKLLPEELSYFYCGGKICPML